MIAFGVDQQSHAAHFLRDRHAPFGGARGSKKPTGQSARSVRLTVATSFVALTFGLLASAVRISGGTSGAISLAWRVGGSVTIVAPLRPGDAPKYMIIIICFKVIRMARRPTPPPEPERPILTVEQKRRRIEQLQKCIQELEAFDPQTVQKRYPPEVTALGTDIDVALSKAFGHGTVEYRRYSSAARLDHGPHFVSTTFRGGGQDDGAHQARQYLAEGKQQSIVLLQRAIRTLEDEIAEQEHEASSAPPTHAAALVPRGRKVFVVHGRDEGALAAMARFLEKIEIEPIVLQEQPDQGFTIIEKFETYAKQVGFAVVLLTPDDLGGSASASSQSARARQNVIFELGYFVGKLGRGRACLLRKGEIEIPSDLYGVIYTEMDAGKGWKLKLAKELKVAEIPFNQAKVLDA